MNCYISTLKLHPNSRVGHAKTNKRSSTHRKNAVNGLNLHTKNDDKPKMTQCDVVCIPRQLKLSTNLSIENDTTSWKRTVTRRVFADVQSRLKDVQGQEFNPKTWQHATKRQVKTAHAALRPDQMNIATNFCLVAASGELLIPLLWKTLQLQIGSVRAGAFDEMLEILP